MPHLKKDFHTRKVFDNKFYNHSYINYLLNNKVKFEMNNGDLVLDRFIVDTIDFIIRLNNAICRRGTKEQNIADIKALYNRPIKNDIYTYYGTKTISEIFNNTKYDELTHDIEKEIYSILEQIIYWKDNFYKDYDKFKDFVFDTITMFDTKKYLLEVGNGICYNRSVRDNANKSFYCIAIGNKGYEKFKQAYYSMIYLNAKDKAKTFEMVCDILIVVADTYNELINKEYSNAYEVLNNYIKDNTMMKECKDIYYAKLYIDLEKILTTFNQKTYTNILTELKSIMLNENYKYKKYVVIYEKIAIDKELLNNGEYYEL